METGWTVDSLHISKHDCLIRHSHLRTIQAPIYIACNVVVPGSKVMYLHSTSLVGHSPNSSSKPRAKYSVNWIMCTLLVVLLHCVSECKGAGIVYFLSLELTHLLLTLPGRQGRH